MPHFADLAETPRAIRPLALAALCACWSCWRRLAAMTPTPTPIAQNTPPPATADAATATPQAAATDTPYCSPPHRYTRADRTEAPTTLPPRLPPPPKRLFPATPGKRSAWSKTYLRDMALLPGGNNIVLAASSDGLWKSSYDYTKWDKLKAPPSATRHPATPQSPSAAPTFTTWQGKRAAPAACP